MKNPSSRSPFRRHQRTRTQSLAIPTVLIAAGALAACSTEVGGVGTIDPPATPPPAQPPAAQASVEQRHEIGGVISGLAGSGLLLAVEGHGSLTVERDGRFAFPTSLAKNDAYTVAIAQQPSSPSQTCVITSGAKGIVAGARSNPVHIECTTNTYQVSGTVSGLARNGRLTITNLGTDAIEIIENGRFDLSGKIASGARFDVAVTSQPSAPAQTCRVSGGSGVVGAGDVSSIRIECEKDRFTIGGRVEGLEGKLIVRNWDWGEVFMTQTLTANGAYALPLSVASGDPYDIEIVAQPSDPHQTCVIANTEGVVSNANVVNADITCTTNRYAVRGTVSGLKSGEGPSGLTLHDERGGVVHVDGNGPFQLPATIASNGAYRLEVSHQPTSPAQTCVISGGEGVVRGADVAGIEVHCSVNTYPVGGVVSGLSGTGLVLQDRAGRKLTVGNDGAFTFPDRVASGDSYAISVAEQPNGPSQTCSVKAGEGVVTNGAVTGVLVNCDVNTFTVGGFISGLDGELALDVDGEEVRYSSNGPFALPHPIPSGAAYEVSVRSQPAFPRQTCTVSHGSGQVSDVDVDAISVTCVTEKFKVKGSVHGLAGGAVTLAMGAQVQTVPADGAFEFAERIASGTHYKVSVLTDPTGPWQTCLVSRGSGVVGGEDVGDVRVDCTTNDYAIGGIVSGLRGSGLALALNGVTLPVGGDGAFNFPAALASGSSYAVTVDAQPSSPEQTCAVSGGSGVVGGGQVSSIAVHCETNAYPVSGSVTGLTGTLVVTNNGADARTLTGDGSFGFTVPVPSGGTYAVAVKTQPAGQTCTVKRGSGTVSNGAINDVSISCEKALTTIGGTVTGLSPGERVLLALNGLNFLTVLENGVYSFPQSFSAGVAYGVIVVESPSNKQCVVTNGVGVMPSEAVTNVNVTCGVRSYTLGQGPNWANSPRTYTCLEACAHLFGGLPDAYACSTNATSITRTAWADGNGNTQHCSSGRSGAVAEDYKKGALYTPGSISAFVSDNCKTDVNYCHVRAQGIP